MASERYIQRYLDDLDSLEKVFPGLCTKLSGCKDRQLAARGKAYIEYTSVELSDEDNARVAALKAFIAQGQSLGVDVSTFEKQVKSLQGGLEQALQAHEDAMSLASSSNDTDSKKSRLTSLHGVYLFHFRTDNASYVGIFTQGQEREVYSVVDLKEDKFSRVDIPAYLSAYKVKSPTAARRLVWAIHSKGVPSQCHDGTGHDGDLAILLDNDPTVWVNAHLSKVKSK